MELSTTLYLIDVLHGLGCFMCWISVFGFIIAIVTLIIKIVGDPDDRTEANAHRNATSTFKWALPLALVSSLVATFIPSQKTMYLMLAAGTAKEVLNNPKVQEISGKVFNIINEKLDELDSHKKEKDQK